MGRFLVSLTLTYQVWFLFFSLELFLFLLFPSSSSYFRLVFPPVLFSSSHAGLAPTPPTQDPKGDKAPLKQKPHSVSVWDGPTLPLYPPPPPPHHGMSVPVARQRCFWESDKLSCQFCSSLFCEETVYQHTLWHEKLKIAVYSNALTHLRAKKTVSSENRFGTSCVSVMAKSRIPLGQIACFFWENFKTRVHTCLQIRS